MKKYLYCFFLFLLLLSAPILSFADDNKIDSLTQLSESTKISEKQKGFMGLAEYYFQKDSSKSNFYLSKVIPDVSLFNKIERDQRLALLGRKIHLLSQVFKHQEAKAVLSKVLKYALNQKDTALIVECHKRISASYYYLSQFDSTSFHLDKAMAIYKKQKDQDNLGLMILRQGGIQYARGNYGEAMRLAFEATEIFKHTNEDKQLALAYMQLGNIYYFLSNYENSSKYYGLSANYYLRMDDKIGWAHAISNLSLLKIEQDSFQIGLELQLKTLPFIKKSGREVSIGNSYNYLAEAYFGIGQLDSSLYFLKKSKVSNQKTGYYEGICYNLLLKAKIKEAQGKIDSAILLAQQAYSMLDSIKSFEAEKEISFFLAGAYEKKKNFKESYRYLKRYNEILDSLDFDESFIQEMALDQQLKLEIAEYELKISQENEKLTEEKNDAQQTLIIVLSVLIAISLTIALLNYTTNRKNRYLNKELRIKQNLIETELQSKRALLNEIHHRVKNNLQIISSMLSIQSQYLSDSKMERVLAECRGRINSMSLIHESLYKSENRSSPLFDEYIRELIPRLIDTYQIDQSRINLKMDLEQIELSLDESTPCGLIINEVVSNSLKHAFPEQRNGEISIKMWREKSKIHLSISDNGIGLPEGFHPDQQDTFGFLLIYTLASQLEAEVSIDSKEGLHYHFSWEENFSANA